jgi:tetratricopeptide (TPR) repeat protein
MGEDSKRGRLRKDRFSIEAAKEAPAVATPFLKPVVHICLIAFIGLFVYSNTLQVPFVFDDESSVYKNIAVRDTGYLTKASLAGILSAPRTIGQLSFTLNYALGGLDVVGYHIVNLVIHVCCALLVYWFVVLLFRAPYFTGYFQGSVDPSFHVRGFVALFAALLFVSHPIQTQAVTYIVQRYASLATLFYLLSFVLYIKFRLSGSSKARHVFYAVSVVSAVLAMKTKEIAFTLPVMITLCEFMFFRGDIKKRVFYLIPLLLTMAIIPLSLIWSHGTSAGGAAVLDRLTRGASLNIISPWDYLNTQFRVIVTYIRLLFLPINQNLDYDYPVYRTFFTAPVFLSFLFLLAIFGLGVYLVYRSLRDKGDKSCWYRLIAFGIFWFFVTLSVESSIIPIADVIFEHRLYLPSAGFFMAVMAGVMWFEGRLGNKPLAGNAVWVVMILIVVGLSATAYARNSVWRDEVTLWEDVVKKSPNKARPHNNLGGLYLMHDRIDEAMKEILLTLRLAPEHADAQNNLGLAFEKLGQSDKAMTHYAEAIRMNPEHADAHSNLGLALKKQGRTGDAVKHFMMALQIDPYHREANNNMGLLSENDGRMDEALNYYEKALHNNPSYADGHNNLGNALIRSGKIDAAIEHIALALQLNPDFAEAEFNMGNCLLLKGRPDEAAYHYTKALGIKPDYPEALNNLGTALLRQGRYEDAIVYYRKALLIRSDFQDAGKNLQIALRSVNKSKDGSDRR